MTAFVVALVVQVGWELARAILQEAFATTSLPVTSLAFGVTVATQLMVAAAAVALARRLANPARAGATIAAVAFGVMAVCSIVREGLVYVPAAGPVGLTWIIAMRDYGWCALEVIAIAGLALAAGRRAAWFAPPAAGLAILGGRPGFIEDPQLRAVAIAFVVGKLLLVLLLVAEAERRAVVREPDRPRAVRGLRRAEYSAWLFAILALTSALPGFTVSSQYAAILVIGARLITYAIMVSGAWALAEANIAGVPRWPLYATATCALWTIMRTGRIWSLTLIHWWGHFSEAPFLPSHWSTAIPDILASLALLGSLVVFARRTASRELLATTALATAVTMLAYGATFGLRHQGELAGACFVAANLLWARMYRVARSTLELPHARAL